MTGGRGMAICSACDVRVDGEQKTVALNGSSESVKEFECPVCGATARRIRNTKTRPSSHRWEGADCIRVELVPYSEVDKYE